MNPHSLAAVIDLRAFGVEAAARRIRTGQCNPLQRRPLAYDMSNIAACPPGDSCRDTLTGVSANVLAGATATLVFTPPVRMRVDAMLVVSTGANGFTLQDFVINNANQWARGQMFHSAIFAPGGDANTAFKADYIDPTTQSSITVINLDGGAAQTIWIALKGPGA